MLHCAIKGPNFPFSPIRSFRAPQFPHRFIKGPQFPHCVIKGPQILHCVIKGPQFPHHVIITMTSNFPSRHQGVPIYHLLHQGAPMSPSRHQSDPNFPILSGPHNWTMWVHWIRPTIRKCNSQRTFYVIWASLSRGVCGGVKGITFYKILACLMHLLFGLEPIEITWMHTHNRSSYCVNAAVPLKLTDMKWHEGLLIPKTQCQAPLARNWVIHQWKEYKTSFTMVQCKRSQDEGFSFYG